MNKFFLGLLTSKETEEYIEKLRKELDLKYSQKVVPHLTLFPPFLTNDNIEGGLINLASDARPFIIKLGQVKRFPEPRNIAYFSVANPNEVTRLRDAAVKKLNDYQEVRNEFVPHVTIAKEVDIDLLNKINDLICKDNREFEFQASSLSLFQKEPKSQIWEMVKEFPFG